MKILRIISSFRGNDSMSLQLGNAIIDVIKRQNAKVEVTVRNLVSDEVPHFNQLHFTSFTTPTESLSPALKVAASYSDVAINELITADVLVIDVPMYNFGIPSSLKAWIDHVVRAGTTFKYTENGVEGLVKNKKVYLSIASGGVYSDGPMKEVDHTEKYLTTILGFIGITKIKTFRVEGTAITGNKENALHKAIQSLAFYNF